MLAYTYNPSTNKHLRLYFPADWSMDDINFFLRGKEHLKLIDKREEAPKIVESKKISGPEIRPETPRETIQTMDKPILPNTAPASIVEATGPVPEPTIKPVHIPTGGQAERACVSCNKVFHYESKRGRPPVKCPTCKG
jgi:hypothetical protein